MDEVLHILFCYLESSSTIPKAISAVKFQHSKRTHFISAPLVLFVTDANGIWTGHTTNDGTNGVAVLWHIVSPNIVSQLGKDEEEETSELDGDKITNRFLLSLS